VDTLLFHGSIELCLSCFFLSLACAFITIEIIRDWRIYQRTKGKENVHELLALKARIKELSPEELLVEMEGFILSKRVSSTTSKISEQSKSMCSFLSVYLEELSSQYCQKIKKDKLGKVNETKASSDNLDIICQKVAYLVLREEENIAESNNAATDQYIQLLSGAISLLALIAKKPFIRQRHFEMANEFGFDIPIKALRKSLTLAEKQSLKNESIAKTTAPSDETDTMIAKEHIVAELHRKGCLFLGAVADESADLAILIVNEAGLELILDILTWYRFHEDIGNWGLWAIFILCYENSNNKGSLIKLHGISVVCQTMKNNPDSIEVQRHGTAILFDLLRHSCQNKNGSSDSIAQVRSLALNAGLQEAVHQAMAKHKKSSEIMMMGREMLVATQFQGNIPSFDGALTRLQ